MLIFWWGGQRKSLWKINMSEVRSRKQNWEGDPHGFLEEGNASGRGKKKKKENPEGEAHLPWTEVKDNHVAGVEWKIEHLIDFMGSYRSLQGPCLLDSINTYFYSKNIQIKLKLVLSLAPLVINLLGVIFLVVGGSWAIYYFSYYLFYWL